MPAICCVTAGSTRTCEWGRTEVVRRWERRRRSARVPSGRASPTGRGRGEEKLRLRRSPAEAIRWLRSTSGTRTRTTQSERPRTRTRRSGRRTRGRLGSPLVPQGAAELDAGRGQLGRFDHSDPLSRLERPRRAARLASQTRADSRARDGKADGDRRAGVPTDSRVIVPWSWITSSRQMASPSPLPSIPARSSRARRTKGSKTCSCDSIGYSRARIGEGHVPGIGNGSPGDANPASRRRVLQGVRREVSEDLLAPRGIGDD